MSAKIDDRPSEYPERLVSLLPSITEVLSSLGEADRIVGITHECDYPPEALEGARVITTSDVTPYSMSQEEIHASVCGSLINGQSLYGIRKEVLRDVRPDVVFTQSLCDVCAVSYPVVLDTCAKIVGGPPPPTPTPTSDNGGGGNGNDRPSPETCQPDRELYPKVISMEPTNLKDVLKTFHVAAKALGRPECQDRAGEVTSRIELGLDRIRTAVEGKPRPKVAFVEWHTPIFSGGHWIPDMLDIAGGTYEMCQSGDRSAPMEDEDFRRLDPDCILIAPCGFALDRALKDTLALYEKKPWWKGMRAVREGQVFALDGNSYYARPGPRLLQGTGIMAACIHGEEVAEELGEELAPSDGYRRITVDMYEGSSTTTTLETASAALSVAPLLPSARLRTHNTCSLFVAWNGVLVLVFDGFPPPLVAAKERLGNALPDLKAEKFGSKWPKTTLAAERDDYDPLSMEELKNLREACRVHSENIASEQRESLVIDVSTVSIVEYECRSLEKLGRRVDVPLSAEFDPSHPSAEEQGRVDSVIAEWSDLESYLPKINSPGSRIGSYREASDRGCTCAAFLNPLPDSLRTELAAFRGTVDKLLPGRYVWLDDESLHCTLRSLDR